jgi:dTDP-4-dehydrorhamnose reductase
VEKPTVWITGAGGLIGSNLVATAARFAPGVQVVGLTRPHLDLLNPIAVQALFRKHPPAGIIHCAAMSKSAECQAHPDPARRINVETTARLAELAADMPFIFLSTDLVFDGRKGNYSETDVVNPLSVYGETKVAAERIVLTNPRHTVIRTSLNGGTSPTGDRGFNEQLRLAWQAGQQPGLFGDEFRSPISAAVTARATWELLTQRRTGLFHVAGTERLSRAAMGELLATRWPQLNPRLKIGSLRDYRGVPRAPDTSLNSGTAQKLLSFRLPGLTEWLRENPAEVF